MAASKPAAGLRRIVLGAEPVRRAIYILGLMPAVWTFYLGLTDQLGADPQNTLERTLGLWALRFLIAALAITPLRRLGGPSLIRYRRAIGLLGFYYAILHLTVYLVLDQGLNAMIRRLGARAWQRLHRLVYVATAAAAVHFLMLVKSWWTPEPVLYAGLIAALLLIRLWLYAQKRLWPKARPLPRPARARG
jgi:sulfoxide reductase heme-binding subunit YedZ